MFSQSTQIIAYIVESKFTSSFIELKWFVAALTVGMMITLGAIKAEAAHAFTVESHDHGEQLVREREVRHAEPELGDGFRPHNWTGTGE